METRKRGRISLRTEGHREPGDEIDFRYTLGMDSFLENTTHDDWIIKS